MPDKITPEQHLDRFLKRRDLGDFHAIFMHGCCYHFALALHQEYKLLLEYVPSQPPADHIPDDPHLPGVGHCWAIKQPGLGIDINGVHSTKVLREIYMVNCNSNSIPIKAALLCACLDARKYLKKMNDEAFALALHIIRKHERLDSARPFDLDFPQDLGEAL